MAAIVCNDFFVDARDRVLREVDWPFATKFADLSGKVDGRDTAGDGTNVKADWASFWGFSYLYPDDCLALREFVTPQGRFPLIEIDHDVITDAGALRIVLDLDSAQDDVTLRYTWRNATYSTWMVDAGAAFSVLLASLICPALTGDVDKAQKLLGMFESFVKAKAVSAARRDQKRTDDDGDFQRSRH
jgi:hypothetical protein